MKRMTFWTLPLLLFISMGLFKALRNDEWYRRKGDPVKARVLQIKDSGETDPSIWRLKATWTDPTNHKAYTFEKIFVDRPHYRAGDFINVFVDPKDPKRYLID